MLQLFWLVWTARSCYKCTVQGLGLGTNSTSSTSTTASSTTTDSSSTQEHSLSSNSGTIKKTKTPSTDVPEATTATSKFGSENGPTRSPSSKCNARERH
ncbi:hypothetical protein PF010_g29036 [Phytophthora fragariae]|uniref:RxLR effector protein n=1 Tax=Phytophthora fragariae TaxID=53985 RepID=A0A6G0JPD6_9STRA|nr:hypothetical protein PF010_g29036 [Phytophthora fragariae]KAE9168553.1 hypothetical protein PF004_g28471 [Phytophthora fragariae]